MAQFERRVALLIQTASAWSRGVLRGIADYAHEHGSWEFFIEPRGVYEKLRLPDSWEGDGIIARVDHSELAQSIVKLGIPAVNTSWAGEHSAAIPKVVSDQLAIGRLAAEHFIDNGFRHYGFVGPPHVRMLEDKIGPQFSLSVQQAGYQCAVLDPDAYRDSDETDDRAARRKHLTQFVLSAPRPMGLLVWSDELGREMIVACEAAGVDVPNDIAILSSEHDALMCALSPIPLSCLDMVPGRVGYQAAKLLDAMMNGAPAPVEPVLVPPVGIVQRQSTDTFAVDDPDLADALAFIRDNADRPIQVTDVLRAVPVSRRALEQKFKDILGRSPAREIRRVRLERAKRLLVETDLLIPVIAQKAGFNHTEVMIRCFRRDLGMTPGQFRRFR